MQTRINLQDTFLTRIRRNKTNVTLFLMNGYQLRGVVTGFDAFVVVLMTDSKQQAAGHLQARHLHHRARAGHRAGGEQ